MRLLLVEDEAEIQGFLQRSPAEAGYQVDAAGHGLNTLVLVPHRQSDYSPGNLSPQQDVEES
jgi:DNA-binding response OmpR family regulator